MEWYLSLFWVPGYILESEIYVFLFDMDCADFSGKIFARKPSYDSESSSLATTASEKLGGHQSDSSSAATDQVEPRETVSEDTQVCCCLLGYVATSITCLVLG